MVAQRLRSTLAVCHREKPLSFLPQEEGALGAGSLWGIYLGHVLWPCGGLESSSLLPTSALSCLGPYSLTSWPLILSEKPLSSARKSFHSDPGTLWVKTNLPASSLVIV